MPELVSPPPLPSPGSKSGPLRAPTTRGRIGVVAPSGPFDPDVFRAGIARLSGFSVEFCDQMLARRHGFLAGTDEERLLELQAALDDPSLDAILVARGGYGLTRILPQLNWDEYHRRPKWVVGFSDVTALHQAAMQAGYRSIHGPNATTLSQLAAAELDALRALLEGAPGAPVKELEVVMPGTAQGPLVGGNLTMLFTEAASGRLHLPDGAILFLEDVAETSYRIDRMLHALVAGGQLAKVAGVVFGDFTNCSPGKHAVTVDEVLRHFAAELALPAMSAFPAGHGERNLSFIHGGLATMDTTKQQLTFE